MATRWQQPPTTTTARGWAGDWDGGVLLIAFGCALVLLVAIVAPREFARTSWVSGGGNAFTVVNDSPAGYVGMVSLGGLAALPALAVAVWWRRAAVAGALLAAVAFGYAAYVAASYWVRLARGIVGLEGRFDAIMRPPAYTVHFPLMLPVFLLAAAAGFACALVLAVHWRQRPEIE